MAESTNRWDEFNAGTLTVGAVVQHDTLDTGEHLVWVLASNGRIYGPFSRWSFDAVVEAEIAATAEALIPPPPDTFTITGEDGAIIEGTI